jgi:hypothetical protein
MPSDVLKTNFFLFFYFWRMNRKVLLTLLLVTSYCFPVSFGQQNNTLDIHSKYATALSVLKSYKKAAKNIEDSVFADQQYNEVCYQYRKKNQGFKKNSNQYLEFELKRFKNFAFLADNVEELQLYKDSLLITLIEFDTTHDIDKHFNKICHCFIHSSESVGIFWRGVG